MLFRSYAHALAENVAPLIAGLMADHDAFVAPATTTGKNVAPRVAALLDVMQVSDILSVEGPKTFTRPIYAGNAIATVEATDAKLVITVRGTAFAKAAATGGSASVESTGANGDSGGDIECVRTGTRVKLGRSDFRFDPRTGEFRLETGCTQCGKWQIGRAHV